MNLTTAFNGKRVLITGHTGFKGSWLSEWLLRLGSDVTGFSLPEKTTDPALFDQLELSSRMEDLRGDIRDLERMKRLVSDVQPDFVFHLAAQPLVRLSYAVPVATYQTNVMGSIHLLEALRQMSKPCAVVMVTTDKCYENREWLHAYREEDPLGGHDPYSSSKGACEIAIASWRQSFFAGHSVKIASARAGNVIGGGDWASDRIVPDAARALMDGVSIPIRNRNSTRPWQHVLEPLSGYIRLAGQLSGGSESSPLLGSFNFGPGPSSNRTVGELVDEFLKHWPGEQADQSEPNAPHEAGKLNLATDKAFHLLRWEPRWNFESTIQRTALWYRDVVSTRCTAKEAVLRDIEAYGPP